MIDTLNNISSSQYMQFLMLSLRIITPLIAFLVVWLSFNSFRRGLRRSVPVILLRDLRNKRIYKVLYWENSIGRSKTCDIVLDNGTVSRDHAVLLRRNEGWYICDSDSTSGVLLNGKKIVDRAIVAIGDIITLGTRELVLEDTEISSSSKKKKPVITPKKTAQFPLLFLASIVHFSMSLQLCIGTGEVSVTPLLLFLAITCVGWGFYLVSAKLIKRTNFEVETIGFLLSGIGLTLLSGHDITEIKTQFFAFIAGIILFSFMLFLMSNTDRVSKWRIVFAIFAIMFFILNMIIGVEINGSKNWIYIAGVSIQPSEVIKIPFILVGAATLDKLQTKKNIGEFIVFAGVCLGFLFIMRDFGSACIFFAGFLILAFMRSGSIRTIILILAVAIIGAVMIINFKPYVAQRFAGWGNIWEHINDSLGYQQTRTLTYIASGGLFGMGLGQGYLYYIAAGDSDLVFGMLCEEQGFLMGLVVAFALVVLVLIVMSDVKRSRSSFYSMTSCAAAGMLMFQACLNIFGSTDILPLTGVTLPFISLGGSSMLSVWGMLAFIKVADERTYRLKKIVEVENPKIKRKVAKPKVIK